MTCDEKNMFTLSWSVIFFSKARASKAPSCALRAEGLKRQSIARQLFQVGRQGKREGVSSNGTQGGGDGGSRRGYPTPRQATPGLPAYPALRTPQAAAAPLRPPNVIIRF
jgi:hypothetical protein